MRAVLDTNVLISALIKDGKPRRLVKALLGEAHTLIISEPMIEEFLRISADEKIRRYVGDDDVAAFLGALLSKANFVRPESNVRVFGDFDDNVLTAAKEGGADTVVTGDRNMLELREFGRTRIVTVDEALSIVKRR